MPLPIIANVAQARLIWTSDSAPRPAVNDLYFKDVVGGASINSLWTLLDASVTAGMWDLVGGTNTKVSSVRLTPLDGITAGTVKTPAGAKWASGSSADPILQGAAVVTFASTIRGPRGRGRIFLPFIAESGQTAGVLSSGSVTTMQAAWTAFINAMGAGSWPQHVVSAVHTDSHVVGAVTVRSFLKTQRRRARR